jgi:Lsr2
VSLADRPFCWRLPTGRSKLVAACLDPDGRTSTGQADDPRRPARCEGLVPKLFGDLIDDRWDKARQEFDVNLRGHVQRMGAAPLGVVLEDDLDGGPADETLRFAIGVTEYEIDLSKKNAKTFHKVLAPFVEHARKVGRRQRRRAVRPSSARERSSDFRAWAKAQGIAVSERGRIPASVIERYEAAAR